MTLTIYKTKKQAFPSLPIHEQTLTHLWTTNVTQLSSHHFKSIVTTDEHTFIFITREEAK